MKSAVERLQAVGTFDEVLFPVIMGDHGNPFGLFHGRFIGFNRT